jgi:four helix bundle protein
MPNKSELLQRRLVLFGASASELSRRLPRDVAGQNVARQLVRAATAPAANYAEAREAESTADYLHRMKICLKELRETAVWISTAQLLSGGQLNADALEKECNELISIFVACLKRARTHA